MSLGSTDIARTFCSEIINRVFRYRKNSFTLNPKIIFVFDEAQEFIPYEKKEKREEIIIYKICIENLRNL